MSSNVVETVTERTLRTPAHFAREIGKTVNVRLASELDGRRRLNGELVASSAQTATVQLVDSGDRVEFPLSLVDKAKTVFIWETQPKPNSKEARDAKRAKSVSPKNPSTEEKEASAS